MDKQEQQFIRMTTHPVEPLLLKLSVPTIFSMLITSIYNMADTYFVGNLGTSATGAVGVSFSLMAVIQAIGFFFGHGSGTTISRQLGSHHAEEAGKMAASGFFLCMICGAFISVLGLCFLEPLALALGSTRTILPYAKDYMRFILLAMPFMASALTLNNQLRFQGYTNYAMVGIVSGGVLNIFLDPLFIYVFHMGVSGAALATAVSQFVSWCLLLRGTWRDGCVAVDSRNFRPRLEHLRLIVRGGSPSLIRQSFGSVATICLNHAAGPWGDAAIAAMGVVSKVIQFFYSVMFGFGQAFQPICGFNYGAKKYDRVKAAFKFALKISTCALTAFGIVCFIFAPNLIGFFRDDQEVVKYGALALRLQCLTLPIVPLIGMSNMMTQTIGKTMQANLLAAAWQGLIFIPLSMILPVFLDFLGVQLSQPIANLVTASIALPVIIKVFREMDTESEKCQ